jgi:hypothetical protein
MPIPDIQLETWANQGASATAQKNYTSIKAAIDSYESWPSGTIHDHYLQGSYRNTTNIYGNSDVDMMVELTSVFYSNLTEAQKATLKLETAQYSLSQFRANVITALTKYYGSQFVDTTGSKSIKVLPDSGRLKADVVVAATYKFYNDNLSLRAEGITFWTNPGNLQFINYPKLHFDNGVQKNSDGYTRGWYKPTIRTYKNARDRIYANKPTLKNKFSSYFTECLLYNIPNEKFGGSNQDNFVDTLNWLREELYSDRAKDMVCQNGIYYLFRDTPMTWNLIAAKSYVSELIELWNNW